MENNLVKENLVSIKPGLIYEWYFKKNGNIDPKNLSLENEVGFWWKCQKGHIWQDTIKHRVFGADCPYCFQEQLEYEKIKKNGDSNKLLKFIFNFNIGKVIPELVDEWNFEKNKDRNIFEIKCNSEEKVWWKCKECATEWESSVIDRIKGISECPKCSKRIKVKVLKDTTYDLKEKYLLKSNIDFIDSFSKRVWWLCKNEHLCKYPIYLKRIDFSCPYCDSMKDSKQNVPEQIVIKQNIPKQNNSKKNVSEQKKSINLFNEFNNYWNKDLRDNSKIEKLNKSVKNLKEDSLKYIVNWNEEKNKGIDPITLSEDSKKVVWWKCSNGHEWKDPFNLVIKNKLKCPFCDIEKIQSKMQNSLRKTLFEFSPELSKEWHPTKNGILTPKNVWCNDPLIVWWKCSECGYEWQNSVVYRKGYGNKCPNCEKNEKKLKKDTCTTKVRNPIVQKMIEEDLVPCTNSLEFLRPEIALEWDYSKNKNLTPSTVNTYNDSVVWWKCKEGHEWKESIKSRCHKKIFECSFCLKDQEEKKLKEKEQEEKKIKEKEKEKIDTIFKQITNISTNKNLNTKIVLPKKRKKNETTLASEFPEIAREFHPIKNAPLTAFDVGPFSRGEVWWLCDKGHEWFTTIRYRTKKNRNSSYCPVCTNIYPAVKGINDLETLCPELVEEWNYEKNGSLKPSDITLLYTKKVWWKCKICGYEWKEFVKVRYENNKTCPNCIKTKDNSVASVDFVEDWPT